MLFYVVLSSCSTPSVGERLRQQCLDGCARTESVCHAFPVLGCSGVCEIGAAQITCASEIETGYRCFAGLPDDQFCAGSPECLERLDESNACLARARSDAGVASDL